MKTQIIRVSEWDANRPGYRVELFVEGTSDDWRTTPVASHDATFGKSLPSKGKTTKPDDPLTEKRVEAILALGAADPAKLRILERALGAFLFAGSVGTHFRDGLHPDAKGGTVPWRTYLDIQAPALTALPWERIARPLGQAFSYEFAIPGYPLSRVGRVRPFVASAPDGDEPIWPVKILIVTGSAPGDPAVKAEEEVIAIKRALRQDLGRTLIVELADRPARKALMTQLEQFQPHVLHFVGHGRFDKGYDDSVLEFRPRSALDNWSWQASEILTDLKPYCPRLVFLNACHSSDPAARRSAVALSDAMLAAGARAVIGMRAPINGTAAAMLAEEFYVRLAEGEPLDACLMYARRRVAQDNAFPYSAPEWSTPCLEFGWVEESVLPICPNSQAKADQILRGHGHLGELFAMVDRSDQRRELLRTIAPATTLKDPANVVLITGAAKTGKSFLARWSLERFGIVGLKLHYVPFPKGEAINFVEFLRAIRDGARGADRSGCGPGCPRLDPASFNEFNRRLNFYLRGENPPDSGGNTSDEMRPWETPDHSVIGQILAEFCGALTAAAGADSLVVVLDNVDVDESQFSDYVVPHFIRPVASATGGKLRLVFVFSDKKSVPPSLIDPPFPIQHVETKGFEKSDFSSLMREYLRLRGSFSDGADAMIDVTASTKITGPWTATWFDQMSYIADILK
jgi:hypothetical protein